MTATTAYQADGGIATITLNRPDELNTIVPPMTDELEAAVFEANRARDVKVIVLRGAGRSFCAGFNFPGGLHQWDEEIATEGAWDPGRAVIMMGRFGTPPAPVDEDVRDRVLSSAHGQRSAGWERPQPSLGQLREQYGGSRVSDEERGEGAMLEAADAGRASEAAPAVPGDVQAIAGIGGVAVLALRRRAGGG